MPNLAPNKALMNTAAWLNAAAVAGTKEAKRAALDEAAVWLSQIDYFFDVPNEETDRV